MNEEVSQPANDIPQTAFVDEIEPKPKPRRPKVRKTKAGLVSIVSGDGLESTVFQLDEIVLTRIVQRWPPGAQERGFVGNQTLEVELLDRRVYITVNELSPKQAHQLAQRVLRLNIPKPEPEPEKPVRHPVDTFFSKEDSKLFRSAITELIATIPVLAEMPMLTTYLTTSMRAEVAKVKAEERDGVVLRVYNSARKAAWAALRGERW